MKIALLTKNSKPMSQEAYQYLVEKGFDVDLYNGLNGEPLPEKLKNEVYDIVVSYISPWIVPEYVLKRTKLHNVNFHPGPPEYPGIGCFNFALYNKENMYGVTAHEMKPKVDTGKIIGVKRFEINDDSVLSLSLKTYNYLFMLFIEVFDYFYLTKNMPYTEATWKRKPYKRSELEALSKIDATMKKKEIERRIKSTYYPGMPAPFIDINGYRFEYNPER